jgi:hypothetical protein
MTRVLLAALVATAGVASGLQQTPIFTTRAEVVAVDVAVREGKRPVAGLMANDFEVLDNGVRQVVTTATRGEIPLDVTLIVDVSNSMGAPDLELFMRAESAGDAWLTEGIRAIGALMRRADRLDIIAAASRFRRVERVDGQLRVAPPGNDEKSGHTSLFDAVIASLILPTPPGRRRLVVVLSDGLDTTSNIPFPIRSEVLDRSDAVVQFIVLGKKPGLGGPALGTSCNPQSRSSDAALIQMVCGERAWVFRNFAARTAGSVVFSVTARDFVPALREGLEEFRSRYVLTYVPSGVSLSGWHRIDVSVRGRKNYEVVARRGYWRH